MAITFTGFINIGAIQETKVLTKQKRYADGYNDEENVEYVEVPRYLCINGELTNKNEKDLDKFEKTLRQYPNYLNKNFIRLEYFDNNFYLNSKILPLADKNLGIYEDLIHLYDKHSEKPHNEYIVSKDYIKSDDCTLMIIPLDVIKEAESEKELNEIKENLHKPYYVQSTLELMSNEINRTVLDYLG